ncbi:MAG: DegV family protein [Lachnospiraceae bacterium]|nr:DegV family protein [Lachnospiraceae bacterium]
MAIRILTDTASECSKEYQTEKGVTIIPMSLTYGEETLQDGVDISTAEFYHKLVGEKAIPVTSQPSPELFLNEFEKAKEAGDSVIAILLSSALSGTVQSATLAKSMAHYDEIYIVDTLNATAAGRIMVDAALMWIEEGKSAEKIARALEKLKERVRVLAVIDTLEYLYKGGRLTKAEAGLGTLANIKPVITLQEGQVKILSKAMGRKRAMRQLMDQMKHKQIDRRFPVYLIYSENKENCINFQSSAGEKGLLPGEEPMLEIGPTIGTHIGGGAFGVVFVERGEKA